jgi:hypothetical protein
MNDLQNNIETRSMLPVLSAGRNGFKALRKKLRAFLFSPQEEKP